MISFSSFRLKSLLMSITMGEKVQSKLDNNRKNLSFFKQVVRGLRQLSDPVGLIKVTFRGLLYLREKSNKVTNNLTSLISMLSLIIINPM